VALSDELTVVVGHMKKSNEFVKQTNKELIKLNRSILRQNRLLWLLALGLLFLLGGNVYALYEQRGARVMLETNAKANQANVAKLAALTAQLEDTQQAAEDTKKAVEEQPTITVKPADTTDPTSKPVLVVQPKTVTVKSKNPKEDPPPPAPTVEIPLDLPEKKK
jgi:hypothetical protein